MCSGRELVRCPTRRRRRSHGARTVCPRSGVSGAASCGLPARRSAAAARWAAGTRVSRRHLDTGPTPRSRLRLDARASVVVFREQYRSRRVLTPREAGPSSVKNASFARSPRRSCSLHARLRQPHAAVAVFPGGSQLDWSEQVPCCPPLRHHHGQLPRLHRQGATWAMGRDSAAAGRRSPGCGSAAGWERQRQPLTIVAPVRRTRSRTSTARTCS